MTQATLRPVHSDPNAAARGARGRPGRRRRAAPLAVARWLGGVPLSRLAVALAGITAGCAAPALDAPPQPAAAVADAPRLPGAFRVAVISDMNGSYGSTDYGPEVTAAIVLIRDRWRPDLVLAAGDLIAGQRPSLTDDNVRAMWAAFDRTVAAPLRAAGIPFGFALGNHDASAYPAHGRDRAFAIEHWRDPSRPTGVVFADRTHFPLYHSFRAGPLFVVAWDATWEGTRSDVPMMRWLEAQLAGPAARGARFRLVLGHLPLYAVAEGRNLPGEVLADADALRALLVRHDVHAYISGHHHAYYPGRRGALELLHSGALGGGPRPLIGDTVPAPRTVTLLDFDAASGDVAYTTFAIEAGADPRRIDDAALPPRIDGLNGYVVRRDLPDGGG
jgi:hypothetical protein